jgi:hypothetical protein
MPHEAEPQADGDPGVDIEPGINEAMDAVEEDLELFESKLQETLDPYQEESSGQVPTRAALTQELADAEAQVKKLTEILELPDHVIHLFLGTERYL